MTLKHQLLAAGGVLALAAGGVVVAVLLQPTDTTREPVSASPHESFLHLATDTMAVSGGHWTFDDKTTPFSAREALNDKPQECLSDSSTEQYDLSLFGPATYDPLKTIDTMTRHWQALDYSVRTVADTGDAIEITAAVPDSSEIGYFASTGTTSITVQGPCVKSAPTSARFCFRARARDRSGNRAERNGHRILQTCRTVAPSGVPANHRAGMPACP